jgi:hypothetical protein
MQMCAIPYFVFLFLDRTQRSMLPIGLFQFIESFNAGFTKFDTKLAQIAHHCSKLRSSISMTHAQNLLHKKKTALKLAW